MITTDLDIDFLKQMYDKFKDTGEGNIKNHVVAKFLEMLGYDSLEFYYEHSMYHRNGRADIAVKIERETYLYVEVKSANNKLDEKEQLQLARYLYDSRLSWGILTNGKTFILMNNSIESLPSLHRPSVDDRVVFKIDIFNKKNENLIEYFSKRSIYDTQITNYFRDIAKYKAYKFPLGGGSWNVYKSTLFNFFKYYADQQKRYRDLGQIRVDEFEDFLKHEMEMKNSKSSGRKIKSIDTFDNKYSHIRSFFQALNIKSNGFDEGKIQLIRRMNLKEEIVESNELLTEDNIELILNFYSNRRDSIRNKALILLCLSFGLERSTLLSLTTDSIYKERLIIGNRELVMPKKLQLILEELKEQHKSNKVKDNCLFYTKYNNEYKPLSESTINYIFDTVSEIDKSNSLWKKLNTAYIRSTLIKKLFENNFSLEEIVYLTGADLVSLSNLISTDDIIENVKTRKNSYQKIHPFHKFLN
ncbi:type I restriction enzyme HsdR N-terminal domain-containing protein [Priestia aryabhattai]|uniref:type I restriction enzyme HsdR N-terminal domain-containing protein n=1 Tax=Priestia aryabhattai TaxID=412384 RepID=UPI003D2CCAEC